MLGSKEKVFLLEDSEIIKRGQDKELRIDRAGLKIASLTTGGVRLNVEGSQLLGPQCTKRVLEIDSNHVELLVKGEDFFLSENELLQVKDNSGLFILRQGDDFLGSGLVKQGRLQNLLSKNRRVKNYNH
jgi:NOL1/NOP2/fmu family ribosome biogenesis protein